MKCQISDERIGLCNTIDLKCSVCSWKYSIETFYQLSKLNLKYGRKLCDLNIQGVIAFCEIVKSLEGISSFCHSMNKLSPLAKKIT